MSSKSLTAKKIEDFEREGREWCELLGKDPEELVQFPHPEGYAVSRRRPQWMGYARFLHDHWLKTVLVSRNNRRSWLKPLQ